MDDFYVFSKPTYPVSAATNDTVKKSNWFGWELKNYQTELKRNSQGINYISRLAKGEKTSNVKFN